MYYLASACQPVLALLEAFTPIYMREDNSLELSQKIFRFMCYNAGGQGEEQGKREKDERGHTPHSNQNRDFGGEMQISHCSLRVRSLCL